MSLLDGIRVADFGRYVAGPWCGALLADLGADVVRVERVGGGDDRPLGAIAADGAGPLFLQCNRGKRSLTLDPRADEGREVVRRLIASSDVVIANLPRAGLEATGLDEASVRAVRPDAVLVHVAAFGYSGPDADRVGFDGVAQVRSGAAYLTGPPGQPTKLYSPWVDFMTATNAAMGALAALWHRERTGEGRTVRGALLRTALTVSNAALMEEEVLALGRVAEGSRTQTAAPADVVPTADGHVIVQVVGDTIFGRFCRLIGRPELTDDPTLRGDDARAERREELCALLADWTSSRPTDEVEAALGGAGIPVGRVASPRQALDDPHPTEAGWWHVVDYPGLAGAARMMGFPVDLAEAGPRGPAPTAGQHTDEVLGELGYEPDEVAALRTAGVI